MILPAVLQLFELFLTHTTHTHTHSKQNNSLCSNVHGLLTFP